MVTRYRSGWVPGFSSPPARVTAVKTVRDRLREASEVLCDSSNRALTEGGKRLTGPSMVDLRCEELAKASMHQLQIRILERAAAAPDERFAPIEFASEFGEPLAM